MIEVGDRMTFGIIGWLKSRYRDIDFEIPIWYPTREKPDNREWLVANGLGGYSMGTVSGANLRRYHAVLVSSMPPPCNRHVVLSRLEETVFVNGREFDLSTNYWASGVVSPTGYKYLESFTCLPCPTWVFEIAGNYLIKQLIHPWGSDEVYVEYNWIPDPDKSESEKDDARISTRFLVGYRPIHQQVKGNSQMKYAQFVSPNQAVIILDNKARRLCLTWTKGEYSTSKNWWWDYNLPIETKRGLPDSEDLYLVGSVSAPLVAESETTVAASFERPIHKVNPRQHLEEMIQRQNLLIERANLDKTQRTVALLLDCDKFLVEDYCSNNEERGLTVIEGYPWFNAGGRASMMSLPGLAISTRRLDDARNILITASRRIKNGIMPNYQKDFDFPAADSELEYEAADTTLWWGWALYHYWKVARDEDFIKVQLPQMVDAAVKYILGTNAGIKIDPVDGLLRCAHKQKVFTWMDTKVEGFPMTQRAGKPIELCALWYNFLETILFLADAVKEPAGNFTEIKAMSERAKGSMQKFWNEDKKCLFDVLEEGVATSPKNDESIRCNQLLAISMPFRAFTPEQEKMVLHMVEQELLTPMGIRTLASSDHNYQGVFGCGLTHPDQYHRDLSRHQGMVYPWLLGHYCDALVNIYGPLPETVNRIKITLQPLFEHFLQEEALGGISEMFDGSRPHLHRGCPESSLSVAELMRWYRWVAKQ